MKKTILIIFGGVALFVSIVFLLLNFVVCPKKYVAEVEAYGLEYEVDSALVFAIINAESGFDPAAVSSAGAMGLMQILPATGQWIAESLGEEFNEKNLLEPKTNIKYGCFYLNYLFEKFTSFEAVVCAYNAGESVVRSWMAGGELKEENIKFAETRRYLQKVEWFYRYYKAAA